MAEKKKEEKKKEETKKKTSKKVSTTSKTNKKENSKKVAVSTKKDTAKVVSKKKTPQKKNTKKTVETKPKSASKKEALKVLDEELLKEDTVVKAKQKKNAIKEKVIDKEEKKVEEKASPLDELLGTPKSEEEKMVEDTGLFSSKTVWYLFILLAVIVICFIYIYTGDKNKENRQSMVNQIAADNKTTSGYKQPAFVESEAVKTIGEFFTMKKQIDAKPTTFLYNYGFATKEDIAKYKKSKDGKYFVTNILYDDIRKHVEGVITRECFDRTFENSFTHKNNLTSVRVEELPEYKYDITEVVSVEAARPTLKVTYTMTPETGAPVTKTSTFAFQVVKGKWIITIIK